MFLERYVLSYLKWNNTFSWAFWFWAYFHHIDLDFDDHFDDHFSMQWRLFALYKIKKAYYKAF